MSRPGPAIRSDCSSEAEASPRRAPRGAAALLLLLAVCAPVFLFGLGARALGDPDEGRNAAVAREMLAARSWATPLFNGAPYLDKPPILFWLIALSYRVLGVSELAARLPAALAALAGIALTWWFARRHLGERAGAIAGAVLASTPLYIVFGRTVIFDMLLALSMTAALYAAFEAMEGRGGRAAGALFFAAAGAGTMIKGPVALAGPLIVAAAWALARRRPALLLRLRPVTGAAIYAALVLPWIAVVEARHPGYLSYVLHGEILNRFTADAFDRARPFYHHLKILLPGYFPWILVVIAAGIRRLHRMRIGRPPKTGLDSAPGRRAVLYCALAIGVYLLFFSAVPSKRAGYLLPCAAPIAVLCGALGSGLVRRDEEARSDLRAASWTVAGACLASAALLAWGGPLGGGLALTMGEYAEVLGRDILFAGTAAAVAAAGACVLILRRGRRPWLSLASMALTIAVMVPMARAVSGYVSEERSSRRVSGFLRERLGPRDRVICYEDYRPGLNFYLRRPIDQVTPDGRVFTSNYLEASAARLSGDPSFRLMPMAGMRDLLGRDEPEVFVLTPRRHWEELPEVAGVPMKRIYEDDFGGVFVRGGAGP